MEHWTETPTDRPLPPGVFEPPDVDQSDPRLHPTELSRPDLLSDHTIYGRLVKIPDYVGVRTRHYLYVEYVNGDRELYDVTADPDEMHNLAGTEPELEAQLAPARRRAARPAAARPAARWNDRTPPVHDDGVVSVGPDDVARITPLAVAPRAELHERGRVERHEVHRRDHGDWTPPADRRSPLDILVESNATRVPDLVPIRYGRMAANPFAYFRGAPAVMAADLARMPATRIWPQICGDAHLSNFGVFGTPERSMIFDLNDFDETLPGPFEWDLKRLTASFVVAARTYGFGNDAGRDAAREAVRAYAYRTEQLSEFSTLDIWYAKTAESDVLALAKGRRLQRRLEKDFAKARRRDSMQAVAKLTARGRRSTGDRRRPAPDRPRPEHDRRDDGAPLLA